MPGTLTAGELFTSHREQLCLQWLAGKAGHDRTLREGSIVQGMDKFLGALVGHMNLSYPNRIQVLGDDELSYLNSLGKNSHQDAVTRLFADKPAFIIIAGVAAVPDELVQLAEQTGTPIFTSILPSYKLISHLQYYLSNLLAERITLHGVFMDVMSIGVLICGDSSMGKSELAFELLTRGHRLIADDAPEFSRIAPDIVNGTCPPLLDGFLEVRGLGVLNVRAMFGDNVIKANKYLRLIIRLEDMREDDSWEVDRLRGSVRMRNVLDVDIPEITLPVGPGRNLAVLIEGAALNHIQHLKGYDAAQDFIDRQRRIMDGGKL
jgi:HPr kinase/phosphorylase